MMMVNVTGSTIFLWELSFRTQYRHGIWELNMKLSIVWPVWPVSYRVVARNSWKVWSKNFSTRCADRAWRCGMDKSCILQLMSFEITDVRRLEHSNLAWAVTVNINSRCAGCSASVSVRNHSRSRGTAGKMEHQWMLPNHPEGKKKNKKNSLWSSKTSFWR